jgi:hypothetical protein
MVNLPPLGYNPMTGLPDRMSGAIPQAPTPGGLSGPLDVLSFASPAALPAGGIIPVRGNAGLVIVEPGFEHSGYTYQVSGAAGPAIPIFPGDAFPVGYDGTPSPNLIINGAGAFGPLVLSFWDPVAGQSQQARAKLHAIGLANFEPLILRRTGLVVSPVYLSSGTNVQGAPGTMLVNPYRGLLVTVTAKAGSAPSAGAGRFQLFIQRMSITGVPIDPPNGTGSDTQLDTTGSFATPLATDIPISYFMAPGLTDNGVNGVGASATSYSKSQGRRPTRLFDVVVFSSGWTSFVIDIEARGIPCP